MREELSGLGLVLLRKRPQRHSCCPAKGGHSEKMTVHEFLLENKTASTLLLNLPDNRTMSNKFPLFVSYLVSGNLF